MALTKVTGQVIKNTTDVTVGVLTVTNTLAVGGTVSIGGTLTYEDVTNVDAVGLITARNGIVVGSGITLSKDGDIFFTGIITGNGSGLTNLATDLVNDTSPQLGGNLDVNTKNIVFGDSGSASDDRLTFGAGTDLSVYHDGSDSEIKESTGNLNIICNSSQAINLKHGSENMLRAITDGAVELYHDNVKKLETSSSGVTLGDGLLLDNATNAGRDVQWQPANDRLAFLDNTKATFGNELDLSIYHDGSNSYIDETGTGGLLIRSGDIYLRNPSNADMIHAQSGGFVKLYHNGTEKLATNSDGIDFGDNVKLRLGDAPDYKIYHNGSNTYHENYTGDLFIKSDQMYLTSWTSGETYLHAVKDGRVALYHDNTLRIETTSTGIQFPTVPDNSFISLEQSGRKSDFNTYFSSSSTGSRIGLDISTGATDGSKTRSVDFWSNGMSFNGDTADANKINDYEEGTFTPSPALTYNPNGRNVTQGTSTGTYVKNGKIVLCEFVAAWTAISGSGSYNMGINGLPFAANGTVNVINGCGRSNVTGNMFNMENINGSQINVFRRYDNGGPNGEADTISGFIVYQST